MQLTYLEQICQIVMVAASIGLAILYLVWSEYERQLKRERQRLASSRQQVTALERELCAVSDLARALHESNGDLARRLELAGAILAGVAMMAEQPAAGAGR